MQTQSAGRPQLQAAYYCTNCGAAAPAKFCPECGQETRIMLPTVRQMMRDAAGRIIAWDGRTWRTILLLLFRPGMLTTEYLRGRRRRYVRPARLFFVTALLLFAAIRLVSTPEDIVKIDLPAASAPGKPPVAITTGDASTTGADSESSLHVDVDTSMDSLAARVDETLPTNIRKHVAQFRRLSAPQQSAQVSSGVLRYGPYAMVALLPVFALLQRVTYFARSRRFPKRPHGYAEHLVFGAHLHAFAFVMIIALLFAHFWFVKMALVIWILVYVGRARRKVYGGGWWLGMLRSLPAGVAYLALLALAMTALIVISIAT